MAVYRVDIELTIVVLASDESEAESVALEHIRDEEHNAIAFVQVLRQYSEVPPNWHAAMPWSRYEESNDKTVAELLPDIMVPTRDELERAGQQRLTE